MLYTASKIKRAIILFNTLSSPNPPEKNIKKKHIFQKPKNPVLTLKLKVTVTMLYTVKSIFSHGMLVRKHFPPDAKTKKVIDKKTRLFKENPHFFWKTPYLTLKLKVKVNMLYTVKSFLSIHMLIRKKFPSPTNNQNIIG